MLPKYLKKMILKLQLPAQKKEFLQQKFIKIDEQKSKNILKYNIAVSRLLLKIVEKQLNEKQMKSSQIILEVLKQIFQRIRNQDVFEIQFIKIRLFLVTYRYKKNYLKEQEDIQVKKIKLFIQKLQKNRYFPLLLQDFYSHIELIYIELIKGIIKHRCSQNGYGYVKKCFTILKKQSNILFQLKDKKDGKYQKIIQNKGKSLQTLFYLEYSILSQNGDLCLSNQLNSILSGYQMIFKKLGLKLDSNYLIQKVTGQTLESDTQSSINQDEKKTDSKIIKVNRQSIRSEVISLRRLSLLEGFNKNIQESIKFIIDVQKKKDVAERRVSLKLPTQISSKSTLKNNSDRLFSLQSQQTHSTIQEAPQHLKQNHSHKKIIFSVSKSKQKVKSKSLSKKQKFNIVMREQNKQKSALLKLNPLHDKNIKNQDLNIKNYHKEMIQQGIVTVAALHRTNL